MTVHHCLDIIAFALHWSPRHDCERDEAVAGLGETHRDGQNEPWIMLSRSRPVEPGVAGRKRPCWQRGVHIHRTNEHQKVIRMAVSLPTRTMVPVAPMRPPLEHSQPLFFLGSCFSSEVSARLQARGHQTTSNPLGTLYNPVSIAQTVERLASGRQLVSSDLSFCERQRHYFSFEAGTAHAAEDPDECLASLNSAIVSGHEALLSSASLFLTMGTAWAYVHRSSGRTVANCHRQPHATFDRQLLSVPNIERRLLDAVRTAQDANPGLRVVLTVSPVRHTKEGATASSRSKAHLLAAVHGVCDAIGWPACAYFPSFEIAIDELRDYRWYAADMIHPSETAADYITERLLEAHFDPTDDDLRASVASLRVARRHKHQRPQSAAASTFAEQQLERCRALHAAHPHMVGLLDGEVQHFTRMLRGPAAAPRPGVD